MSQLFNDKKGFTIAELLVTMSVIAFMSTLILVNFPQFNRSLAMGRSARSLGLALRDAENRSVAISQAACTTPGAPDCFPLNFGINVDLTTPGGFIMFTDRDFAGNDPGVYDPYTVGTEECGLDTVECVTEYQFTQDIRVNQILRPCGACPFDDGTGGDRNEDNLHVLFSRPDPAIDIYTRKDGTYFQLDGGGIGPYKIFLAPASFTGQCATWNGISDVVDPVCSTVTVWLTGQIAVEA
ncbi:MAG: prepilin-type N-terminal cleavage/methylation domain-containing protein [Patescibacteria group bacterium]